MSAVLKFDKSMKLNKDFIDAPNLTDRMSDQDLSKLGNRVWEGYTRDLQSRSSWEKRMEAGLDLAMQVQKAKNFPWPNCANVVFPLVTIAALQFGSRSYSSIIQGIDVVRYRVVGEDAAGEARKRADRISKHMSWQVLEEDLSWEEQHDRLLVNLGIVGVNFVKTYFSPTLGHNTSELVLARDFVINYWAKSVESAVRKTQVVPMYRNEIYERVKSGIFHKDILNEAWFNSPPVLEPASQRHDERVGQTPPQPDEDSPFLTLEQHRLLDLDQDGYAEPYICTVEKSSQKVLRLVSRVEREEDIERNDSKQIRVIHATEYFTKYGFIPAPDGGIYDIGFGILLGPLNESVNTGINQLLDSGTMMNSNGGFLGRGAKIRGGAVTFAPFEWKRVDATGDDLRKSLVPLEIREPSNVMYQLIGLIINYADRLAGTVDTMVGENPGQNTPAETSRNMTEQGMQVYSSIFKRVWRSMKEEFKKLHRLNAIYLPSRQRFGTAADYALQEDYKSNPDLVVPSADPHITSNAMRYYQAAALREAAHQVPGYNIPLVEKNFIKALRVEGADQYYPGPDKVPPLPNPKMQVEQVKLQAKQMDLEFRKLELQATLMEQRRVNTAKIAQLEAQAIKLVADVKGDQAAQHIEAFNAAINAHKALNDALTDRIKALGESGDGDSNRGGVPGVEGQPGNAGAMGAAAPVAGGTEGAVGGGTVSTG